MSFLLDALGKADDDRRRAAVPELRTPGQRRNTPARKFLKLLLLLGLVLLSFALGFLSRPYFESGFTVRFGGDGAKPSAQLKTAGNEPSVQGLNAVTEENTQASPAMTIELSVISYSSVPTERFAMLNGYLLYEGDVLSAGERLIEITPEGVLLEKDGRQIHLGLAIAPRRQSSAE